MNHFFLFFLHETWNYFVYFRIYSLFIFSLIFFFYRLFIMRILGNKQKLYVFCFFHYYEHRATMYESILKISSIFTFFSDITYETFFHRWLFETKKKHFYLIWCWFIFFYLIDKGFCPVPVFVFCNKLDRIRRKNFGTKVPNRANISKSILI